MQPYIRTDLASEWFGQNETIAGVTTHTDSCEDYELFSTHIHTKEAAEALGKPQGHYAVLQLGAFHLHLRARQQAIFHRLAQELQDFIARSAPHAKKVMVVGLGNRAVTPDALGPLCVEELVVTRHLKSAAPDLYAMADCELSALSPGVVGQTGIETLEQIASVAKIVSPDLILAIDALAARSIDRLTSSVQLSDGGIAPGAGVGNRRTELSQKTLGVPVLSVGVPTVTDSATLVYDALAQGGVGDIPPSLAQLLQNGKRFFVTAKDCDIAVASLAKLIAHAINFVLVPALSESGF